MHRTCRVVLDHMDEKMILCNYIMLYYHMLYYLFHCILFCEQRDYDDSDNENDSDLYNS